MICWVGVSIFLMMNTLTIWPSVNGLKLLVNNQVITTVPEQVMNVYFIKIRFIYLEEQTTMTGKMISLNMTSLKTNGKNYYNKVKYLYLDPEQGGLLTKITCISLVVIKKRVETTIMICSIMTWLGNAGSVQTRQVKCQV